MTRSNRPLRGTSRRTAIVDRDGCRCFVERKGKHWFLSAGIDSDFHDDIPENDSYASVKLTNRQRLALIAALEDPTQ